MVAKYNIAGMQVPSHYLAILTLTTVFGTSAYFMRGPAKPANNTPPINAASSDEADFIKKFIESADAEEKKAKH